MANLNNREKLSLEELFEMESGYVMDFSNASFSRFIKCSIGIDIYDDPGYEAYCSKANKLRQIWEKEPDNVVGILTEEMLLYYEDMQLRQNKLTKDKRKKIEEMRCAVHD